MKLLSLLTFLCFLTTQLQSQTPTIGRTPSTSGLTLFGTPHLVHTNGATELFVDGHPLLIRGDELGNSSASSMAYMKPIWPKLLNMHLNTVIVPIYWDLLEPNEGKFDFTLVDALITTADGNRVDA